VARELGATTGLLTHYFGSKRELVGHALVPDRFPAERQYGVLDELLAALS
jgi:AcrR family transcriptional regulator